MDRVPSSYRAGFPNSIFFSRDFFDTFVKDLVVFIAPKLIFDLCNDFCSTSVLSKLKFFFQSPDSITKFNLLFNIFPL